MSKCCHRQENEQLMFPNIKADLDRHLSCDGRESKSVLWAIFIVVFAYGFHASSVYRYGKSLDRFLGHWSLKPLFLIFNIGYVVGKYLTEKMYGISIDREADIAAGFYIGHFGGIKVKKCKIGKLCNVHQQVKIGEGCLLGDNVWVGAHATLADGVEAASFSTVMVGARLASSIVSYSLASGNPARIINKNYDNSSLLGLKND